MVGPTSSVQIFLDLNLRIETSGLILYGVLIGVWIFIKEVETRTGSSCNP